MHSLGNKTLDVHTCFVYTWWPASHNLWFWCEISRGSRPALRRDIHRPQGSEKSAEIIIIIEMYNFSGHSLTRKIILELKINWFLSLCTVCILGFLVLNCFLLTHSLAWGVKWGGGLSWELLTPGEVQIIMLLIVLGSVVIQDTSRVKVHINPQGAKNVPNPNLLVRHGLACTFMDPLPVITHPDCAYPHSRFCMKIILLRQQRLPDEH